MLTVEYMAACKARLKITSDYALAKALHLSKQQGRNLSKGNSVMGATTAARVALILALPVHQVIADAELERGSDRTLWELVRAVALWPLALALGVASSSPAPVYAASSFDITPSCAASRARAPGDVFAPGMRQKYTLRRIRRVAGAIAAALVAWLAML